MTNVGSFLLRVGDWGRTFMDDVIKVQQQPELLPRYCLTCPQHPEQGVPQPINGTACGVVGPALLAAVCLSVCLSACLPVCLLGLLREMKPVCTCRHVQNLRTNTWLQML